MMRLNEVQQGRMENENQQRQRTSKILAPQVAQLALRSRSLIDEVLYGEYSKISTLIT